jgi:putative transposase
MIQSIYHKHKGRLGYRRIALLLRWQGQIINHKTVLLLMNTLKLKGVIRVKRYKSYKGERRKITPNLKSVMTMLDKAFKKINTPQSLLLHSDQGWQYQIKQYQHLLQEKGITQSISRKRSCLDNAVIENLFGILKSELFYLKKYDSIF